MQFVKLRTIAIVSLLSTIVCGCGMPAGNTVSGPVNSNSNSNNLGTNAFNSNINTSTSSGSVVDTREPDQYQANVQLTLETIGDTQRATLPAIGANVARSGADRVMEFALPTGEKIIYLEKGGINYVILPNRKQYAELTKEALGFEVRRLMMPGEIVNQVKRIPGMTLVGEESINGRPVIRYVYSAATDTKTQAGTVATDSFLLVDKETGLPLRSETVSQSQSGGNVQGYKGLRVVTQMSDIKTTPDPTLFNVPTEFQKIDPEQVKAQANLIFSAIAALMDQVVNQAQSAASPTVSPVR